MSPTPYDIYWEPSDWLFLIDPTTGLTIGTTQLLGFPSFIDEYGEVQVTDSTTAMAFVGSTLYASFSKYGYGEHTMILGTIDLSTGEITEIGKMTGMNMMPTGGLEYVGGIMYAVSAGTGLSSLYTINLDTGAATLVAPITLNDDQIRGATALAFADGKMYTLINRAAELYSVDLITGVLTEEFNLGLELNSLSAEKPLPFYPIDISMQMVEIEFRHRPGSDKYKVKGEAIVPEGSDGIDPAGEDVSVTVGTSSLAIPAGSFWGRGPIYWFRGTIDDVKVKMIIRQLDTDFFKFSVKADGVDLTGTSNPVNIFLQIGNNQGEDSIKLKGKLTSGYDKECDDDDDDDDEDDDKEDKRRWRGWRR